MIKLKKTGYHRPRMIKKMAEERPKTGLNSVIPTITLTEEQKLTLASQSIGQSTRESIRTYVQEHFPQEFTNHEMYDDWEKCSITVNKVYRWIKNVKTAGTATVPWKFPSSSHSKRKHEEGLVRAKSEIEEIKKSACNLTGGKLAEKMGICRSTANKYLNILERQKGQTAKLDNL